MRLHADRQASSSAAAPAAPTPASLLEAAQLARTVATSTPATPLLARALLARQPDIDPAKLREAEQFVDGGKKGPTAIAAGGGGGFDAELDPKGGVMTITVRARVQFKDGIDASGTAAPGLEAAARRIAAMPDGPRKTAALARFKWNAAEKMPWIAKLKGIVEKTWSAKHQFFCSKGKEWEWVGVRNVRVVVDAKAADDRGDAHLMIKVYKRPPDIPEIVSSEAPFGDKNNPHDQEMTLGSTDIEPGKNEHFLQPVLADFSGEAPTAAGLSTVTAFATQWKGATGDARSMPVTVNIHARSPAGADAGIAQRRLAVVHAALVAGGVDGGKIRHNAHPAGANFGGGDHQVMLVPGNAQKINIAAHEFGHTFGLTDVYTGQGRPAGRDTAQSDIVKDMKDAQGNPIKGGVVEDNDDIMSLGTKVTAADYAPFFQALRQISGIAEWGVGAPKPKPKAPAAATTGAVPAAN